MFSRTAVAALLTSTAYGYAYVAEGSLPALTPSPAPLATGTAGDPFLPPNTPADGIGCATDYDAEGVYDQCKCAFPGVQYECASGAAGTAPGQPKAAYGANVRRHAHKARLETGYSALPPVPTGVAGPPGAGRADCYLFTQGKTPENGQPVAAVQIPCWTVGGMGTKSAEPSWSLAGSWQPSGTGVSAASVTPEVSGAASSVASSASVSSIIVESSVPAGYGGASAAPSAATEAAAKAYGGSY